MGNGIAVVTGANSGIGKITTHALLENGYRVVMVCRNPEKTKSARKELIEKSGNDRAGYFDL